MKVTFSRSVFFADYKSVISFAVARQIFELLRCKVLLLVPVISCEEIEHKTHDISVMKNILTVHIELTEQLTEHLNSTDTKLNPFM